MGTKSFFNKQKSQEVKVRGQEKSTIADIRDDIESEDYVKEHTIDKLNFLPELDFEDPKNFVKYGSAKDYYVDLVDSVVQSYPYDGSLAEKLNYRNGLVAIQKHEFDKNYPRFVGYANFGDESYSAVLGTPFTVGDITFTFGQNVTDHYVITDNYSKNLVYNSTSSQVGSIELNFSEGVTVEFWMKKEFFPDPSETQNEVIFSISNERTATDLFQITTDVTGSGKEKLYATFSKTTSYEPEFVYEFDTGISQSNGLGLADGNWHHYAFAFSTSSTGYVGEFYVDGRFREKKFYTHPSPQFNLTGTLDATVAASSHYTYLGDGSLLGSIDEVRLWKTARNAKEIGVNYFFDVGGGGNTDTTKVNDNNPLGLSLYYKFNESNTGDSNVDSVVLDYSGRLTDGVWVGYNTTSRTSGSAIIESGTTREVGEPIIYSTHPDVVTYKADKITSGSLYDAENIGSMYDMLPQWISDDDAANGLLIRKMMQIMSSYLDTLHAQITAISQLQDGSYVSGSNAKPNPFSKRNLISYGFDIPDVFIDPGVIEEIYFKDEKRVYEEKLYNLKNLIFQNIFNNLNYINKSKGTEKSFRNLFRCFGVDNELVRLNMYADGQEYELKENYVASQAKRNIIDLSGYNDGNSRSSVIYTFADPSKSTDETGDSGYIPSSSNVYIPLTFENQFQFPKFVDFPDNYLDKLSKVSLFGVHSASSDTTSTTIPTGDLNFKVYAETNTNNKTQFVLETNIGTVTELTSSFYEDVYDNTNWTFAVRTKPREYPFAQHVTASDVFDLEFYGVNYVSGYKLHEFTASAEVNLNDDIGQFITGSNKRLYVGADRENITGSLNYKSNTRLVSSRVWFDYLEDQELRNHAKDVTNYGREYPYQNSFIFENGESESYVPRISTLALHWNFENITGSDSSGKFLIQDTTSGSSYELDSRFAGGEYSRYVGPNYSGQGSEFSTNSTDVVDFLFVDTAEQQLPENLYSSDLIEIRQGDDSIFKKDSRPSKYYFAVETSLYDSISHDILGFFASINDFNSLIGAPENAYRPNYKNLEKLRQLFFENVTNEPDLEKFVNLYKWMDGALDSVISNLIPASAKTSDQVRNIVESHILERSKYIRKYLSVLEYTIPFNANLNNNSNVLLPTNEGVTSIQINPPSGAPLVSTIKSVSSMTNYVDSEIIGNTSPKYKQGLQPGNKTFKDKTSFATSAELSTPTAQTKDSPSQIVSSKDLSSPLPGTFFGSPLDQGTKQLWFLNKAERNPGGLLSTGVESVDAARVQQQYNNYQVLTGSRQPVYTFRANASKPISQNTTYGGENKKSYFASSFNGTNDETKDGLDIEVLKTVLNRDDQPYYDYVDSLDRTFGGHRMPPTKITNLSNSQNLNGQNYLPFNIISASTAVNAWQEELFTEGHEIDIVSSHQDYVVDGGSLQGPFTKDHAGGWMYRHNAPLLTSSHLRKEGYTFMPINSTNLRVLSPRYYNSGGSPVYNSARPYGALLREEVAQRPVVIKNISGSNYFHDYQIVQTAGRKENNRYYVKSNGYTGTVNNVSDIGYDEAGVFIYKDFTVLNRDTTGSNTFVIVNRFSAPGGPEVSSFSFLDVEAAEYSVYNNLNYRNLVVRIENNKLLTRHTLTGGYDSVLLQPTASFYKPQRNGVYTVSSSLTTVEPVFDNSYVNYSIPRTDVQYAWVASSWIARKTGYPNEATLTSDSGLLTASGINNLGGNESDFDYNITSSDYSPVYGFRFSENIRNIDKSHAQFEINSNNESVPFNGVNFIIVGDVDTDNNLFTTSSTTEGNYLSRATFDSSTSPLVLNAFLLSENGPYQYPTFKQIRTADHRVARKLRKENIYVSNRDKYILGNTKVLKNGEKYTINQTPVTNKYKPVVQYIDDTTGTIKYEFGNDLNYFATTYISSANENVNYNFEFNVPRNDILDTDFYKFSQKYKIVRYKEVNYPKNENQYKNESRNRINYLSFWVSDDIENRIDNSFVNSQGYTISGSEWSMDVSPSGSGEEEKSGELMRNTGSTGVGTVAFGEVNARYAFNLGECRPKNLVQSQAGTGAFYTTYEDFSADTRLIGQDETIVPEFTISDYIDTVVNEYQGNFLNEDIYGYTLTGSEDLHGNHFAERFLKTEKIDYLKELKEFYGEPTAIRLSFDATKKLLPRTGFYPQQRVVELAQQFSSSYKDSTITIGATNYTNPTGGGGEETWSTALLPFWAPGVGLNSIKSGFAVEFPYKSTGTADPTAGVEERFDAAAPFESILSPSEYVELVYHIANSGTAELQSTASVNKTDGVYEMMSHNFFAEVPDFFLEDLASFRSAPAATWQFEGPLSSSTDGVKKFAMDIYIEDPVDFLMYGGGDAFGPFPYNNHAPPGYYWNSSGVIPAEYCEFLTNTGANRSGYTRAKIVFDPTNLLSTDGRLGKTSFSLQDIVANSTIEHTNFLVERDGVSPADTTFMTLSASLDMFVQGEENRWIIRSKWECPVLNFADATAETDGSETAVKGMWHQYGELAGSNARKRLNVRVDDSEYINSTATGSLAEAVGFDKKSIAFGKIKPKKVVEEAICAIPYYVDCDTGEEKFFEIPMNIFENRYSLVRRNSVTVDSISDMIRKMDKYVLPPPYDFVHIRDSKNSALNSKEDFLPARPPFSIYFFEFNSELSRQDLANIWQGVMPSIATSAEKQKVVLEHPIVDGELLSPTIFRYNKLTGIPNDIKWKIFKVKKRAAYDYYRMLQDKTDSPTYKRLGVDRFSFNYPYDQFSLVELGKMDVEFEVLNDAPSRIKEISGGGYVRPEEAIVRSAGIGQPVQVRTSTTQQETTADREVQRIAETVDREVQTIQREAESVPSTIDPFVPTIQTTFTAPEPTIEPFVPSLQASLTAGTPTVETFIPSVDRGDVTVTTSTVNESGTITTGDPQLAQTSISVPTCTEDDKSEYDALQILVSDVGFAALPREQQLRFNELAQKCPRN
jgi:hypothetical protein